MARKRPPLSFPELEHRGRGAILRSAQEVQAEQELLQAREGKDDAPSPPETAEVSAAGAEARPDRAEDLEAIRKAVKQLGKEAAVYRFTPEEKKALRAIVYTYKSRGIRTSENEITRIAINFLVADYRENGQSSTLARVLELLNH
jgi:hypothetical protein